MHLEMGPHLRSLSNHDNTPIDAWSRSSVHACGVQGAARRAVLAEAPRGGQPTMTTVNIRYMVDDVEAAVAFYTTHLGFTLISKTLPAFADVALAILQLLPNGPNNLAGRPMPHRRQPGPGRLTRHH